METTTSSRKQRSTSHVDVNLFCTTFAIRSVGHLYSSTNNTSNIHAMNDHTTMPIRCHSIIRYMKNGCTTNANGITYLWQPLHHELLAHPHPLAVVWPTHHPWRQFDCNHSTTAAGVDLTHHSQNPDTGKRACYPNHCC
jgi:hypothetical protein